MSLRKITFEGRVKYVSSQSEKEVETDSAQEESKGDST